MASILRISEAATMGIHAIAFLANSDDDPQSTKSIAVTLACSEAHLSKVLQRLTKVGMLTATRGPKGGFILDKPSSEITLLEIYESIDGKLPSTACMFDKQVCNGHECLVDTLLSSINDQVFEYFKNTTMDSQDGVRWYKSLVEQGIVKA